MLPMQSNKLMAGMLIVVVFVILMAMIISLMMQGHPIPGMFSLPSPTPTSSI